MDNSFTKESHMSETDKIVNFRLDSLESNNKELRQDIKDVKDLCIRMDKKLANVPDGFKCDVHSLNITTLSKRVDKVEDSTENITKKIITWTSAIAVLLFLVSQLAIPYALGNFKIIDSNNHVVPTVSTTNNVAVKNVK